MAYVGQSPDAHFSATAVKDSFDGDGSTTAFTLTNGGSTNTVDVFVENVRQEPTEAYSVDGTTLTFSEAPPTGTGNIYVVNKSPVRLQATHPSGLALEAHSATISTDLTVDTDTLYVDSTNNRVGIGTTSPSYPLTIKTADENHIRLENGSELGIVRLTDDGILDLWAHGTDEITFRNGTGSGTERMRIDSSGNVHIGTTAAGSYPKNGHSIRGGDSAIFSRDGTGETLQVRRNANTGELIRLYSGSSTIVGKIGSISTAVSYMVLDPRSGGVGIAGVGAPNGAIVPTDQSGNTADNAKDLGFSTVRWDDVYATNGTIQTSDQNEKQQIASLTDAEITAAKAISKLFKTFKWNDSVTENGDNARTHTGVIAQDVQQAMTDAGLDAGDYAFFISATWWEANGEIYDTQADAPQGATERTRLGIRYPELLAFVGAATEQRLADIETRIAALEAAD